MSATISLIAACDANGLIGKANHLPWSIKEDLQYFRETTMGHPVVMGKNTWFSIGKPLDGRVNVILTSDLQFIIPGCLVMHTVEEVLSAFQNEEVFVIGGAKVFRAFLPHAAKLYITKINHPYEGDTYFPPLDWSQWKMVFFESKVTSAGLALSFEHWVKK